MFDEQLEARILESGDVADRATGFPTRSNPCLEPTLKIATRRSPSRFPVPYSLFDGSRLLGPISL